MPTLLPPPDKQPPVGGGKPKDPKPKDKDEKEVN